MELKYPLQMYFVPSIEDNQYSFNALDSFTRIEVCIIKIFCHYDTFKSNSQFH